MPIESDRREFLRNAALLIPAMHLAGWSPALTQRPAAELRPVEFLRLRLQASQPAVLRNFYEKVLELPTTLESEALSVRVGRTELLFVRDAKNEKPFYHVAFNIPENKLDHAIEWMRGRADLITHPTTGRIIFEYPNWNANSVYFYDPAGNILEFIARHNLKNARDGAFDSRDILYASEMGIVVPDVTPAITDLKNKLGITDYIGVGDAFAPVGNEHGLFIVVRSDRKWFNRIPPGIFPAEVRMRGGTAGTHSISAGALTIEVVS